MAIGSSGGRRDENAGASVPIHLKYGKDFQLSEELESRNTTLDKINLFIVYYLGAYFCDLDYGASFREMKDEEEEDEHTCHHWPPPPPPPPPSTGDSNILPVGTRAPCYSSSEPLDPQETNKKKRKKRPAATGQSLLGALKMRGSHCRGIETSRWKRELRFGWFPKLVHACYLSTIVYLLIAAYYQYAYDFDLLRLLRIRRRHPGWSNALAGEVLAHELAPEDPMKPQEMELVGRLRETRATIDLLGPSFAHLAILAECLYVAAIALTLGIHLGPYLHYRLQQPFDFHIVRNLLDRKRESANIQRMVEWHAGKFVDSGRVYRENVTKFNTPLGQWATAYQLFVPIMYDDCLAETLRTALKREKATQRLVREMLSSGSLTPLYRLRVWTKRRALLQFQYHLGLCLYSIAFDLTLMSAFLAQASREEAGMPSSWCLGLCWVLSFWLVLPSVVVHAAVFMVVILEQIAYVDQLRKLIKLCIRANTNEFLLICASSKRGKKLRRMKSSSPPPPPAGIHKFQFDFESPTTGQQSTAIHIQSHYDQVSVQNLNSNHNNCRLSPVTTSARRQGPVASPDCFHRERIRSEKRTRERADAGEQQNGQVVVVPTTTTTTITTTCPLPPDEEDEHARTMNSNLIFSLLHYKIFVAQLVPMRRSLGFVNLLALYILFTIPIITRIHEPYLNQLNDGLLSPTELKIFALAMGSSVLLPANLVSMPICHLSARCKDLYKDLASLMAHISQVKAHPRGRNLYDSHAESCLLKELADSRRLLERMTVRAGGLSGTYTVSLKAHFWYGLVAISILADNNNNYMSTTNTTDQELFGTILSDPLGVYSRIKVEI